MAKILKIDEMCKVVRAEEGMPEYGEDYTFNDLIARMLEVDKKRNDIEFRIEINRYTFVLKMDKDGAANGRLRNLELIVIDRSNAKTEVSKFRTKREGIEVFDKANVALKKSEVNDTAIEVLANIISEIDDGGTASSYLNSEKYKSVINDRDGFLVCMMSKYKDI